MGFTNSNLASTFAVCEFNVQTHRAMGLKLVKSGGRSRGSVEFDQSVVSFFVETADGVGVPRSLAAIYAICFATREPLSFSDIKDRLSMSAGSISQGLRLLRQIGALRVVRVCGDKRDRFSPELSMRNLAARFLEEKVLTQLRSSQARYELIMNSLPGLPQGEAVELRSRLLALRAWQDKGHALIPLIRAFLQATG